MRQFSGELERDEGEDGSSQEPGLEQPERASKQSRYSFGAESTDLVTPAWKSRWTFTRVNMVHFEPALRDRRGYAFAAVEIFVTRGDGSYRDEC